MTWGISLTWRRSGRVAESLRYERRRCWLYEGRLRSSGTRRGGLRVHKRIKVGDRQDVVATEFEGAWEGA
jgi:hypothetical protein